MKVVMFIRLQKSATSDRIQVHLVEGYRNEKGQPRQRIIKNYGELNELKAQDPDIIEKLKAEAKVLTKMRNEAKITDHHFKWWYENQPL